jgi:hypothetical protein
MSDNLANWLKQTKEKTSYINIETEKVKNEVQVLIDDLNVIRSGANLIDHNMLSEEDNQRLSIMDSILLFGRNTIKGLKPKSNDIFRQAEIYIK